MKSYDTVTIESVTVEDIRFRFPWMGHGSDAINPHTDYSNPYVTINTTQGDGVGIGFSLGKGNEMICSAVEELAPLVEGRSLEEVVFGFGEFKWILSNPVQSRWIAPGAGPYYMAGGAIMNAAFDLWAKLENKPMWQALAELPSDRLLSMMDFRYVEHYVTQQDAQEYLESSQAGLNARIDELQTRGLPCYFTTWIGSDTGELIEQIRGEMDHRGIHRFKVKVGVSLDHDRGRLSALRDEFGYDIELYTDSNQVWSVSQAIEWMNALSEFGVKWIEEPTAPDSISGHKQIREALQKVGIDVVTGENCPNPQLAVQLIGEGAVDRFQVDACRMMGPPDVMMVMIAARKYGVPVCPHAGGSGLDELVPHLAAWNLLRCSPDPERVIVEQVGFCSEFFDRPSTVENGVIRLPQTPGYLVGMTESARSTYDFPDGSAWQSSD